MLSPVALLDNGALNKGERDVWNRKTERGFALVEFKVDAAPVHCFVHRSEDFMSDPKQPIYNAMNWLGGVMPCKKPDDSQLIINAYEKVYTLPDQDTQRLFLDVIQRLRFRDATIENVMVAWDKSAEQLRAACQMIGDPK